jgi:FkbM family methyltransferase
MSITAKYNFKVVYDQFGTPVPEDYYDKSEVLLIEEFEKSVLDINSTDKDLYSMLELGSNQCYYSMLFKSILKDRKVLNLMVEPTDEYIVRGRVNFAVNNYEGVFINKSIGDTWVAHNVKIQKEQTTVDDLIQEFNIDVLDILHSDIDGSELTMLKGAENSLANKKIKYAFILTHGIEIHNDCLNFVNNFDYEIILNHKEDNVGADRLIVIKSR